MHIFTVFYLALIVRNTFIVLFPTAPMPKDQQKKKVKARGVSNRNRGLQWIRENYVDTRGVIYFADDDNTYDLRLFDEVSPCHIAFLFIYPLSSSNIKCPLLAPSLLYNTI